MRARSIALGLVSVVVACAASAQQRLGPPTEDNPVRHQPADPAAGLGDAPRMIVKFRSESSADARIQSAASDAATSAAVTTFATRAGVTVREARALAAGMRVLRIEPRAGESFAQQLERVRADPDVEFAVPDERRFPHAVPNDPLYDKQWHLQNGAFVASSTDPTLNTQPSAVHAPAAWDLGVGSSALVIASIDTGALYNHPDMNGRLLPGYDFVTDVATANDGDGRDSDATDPGDWVTPAEDRSGPFKGCGAEDSSWHGTRTAGIMGAASNNGVGLAGVTWKPKILPARVLGKCGGDDSDIIDAMAWAAGLHVSGVPDNPQENWAKVENLSLGSQESCPASYRTVISQLTARGVIVVASAGNGGGAVDAPADCPGVVAVGGLRHTGTKVGYSSLGPEVTISAPSGNCVNENGGTCLFSIDSPANDGVTTPGSDTYCVQCDYNVGTSFSAPIVSGIAALMRSVNGTMTSAQLIARLQQGATPFPPASGVQVCSASGANSVECACTTSTCGAGMANAEQSLQAALRPMAIITGPAPSSVSPGQQVSLSGSTSFVADGRTISSYLWSIVSGTGTLTSTNTADTSIVTPNSGGVTVRLTVTDDAGRQDTADWSFVATGVGVTISPTSASVQASGGTQTFTATVTNAQNTAVTWRVNGITGGNATVGTISASGIYTAPASVPTPATVTVTAVSVQDPTRSGSAQVTITAPPPPVGVMVAPATANVQAGSGTQTFTATVTNAQNTAVTWRVNGVNGGNATVGTISATGVYSAPATVPTPATVTVTATSVQDPTRLGSAQVTITSPPPPPVGVSVAPATASVQAAGATQAFTATVTNAQNTSVTWQVNGVNGGNATVGTISASGVYTAPASVPSPATVTVTAVSVQDPTKTASAQVTITAPPSSSGGGGGGGALDLVGLLCLVALGRRFAPLRARRAA